MVSHPFPTRGVDRVGSGWGSPKEATSPQLEGRGRGKTHQTTLKYSHDTLKDLRRDIVSHFFDGLNYGLSVRKPKNNGLLRKKKAKRNEDG